MFLNLNNVSVIFVDMVRFKIIKKSLKKKKLRIRRKHYLEEISRRGKTIILFSGIKFKLCIEAIYRLYVSASTELAEFY